MPQVRYFLELSYKGTHYSGWQLQQNALSVQQKINEALSILLRTPVLSAGCGRTDTGVHAKQFFAQFDSENEITKAPQFIYSLNSMLPADVAILDLHPVHKDASARRDAISRTYEYYFITDKNPFLKEFAAMLPYETDVFKINEACKILYEHNDFKSFCKSRTQVNHTLCKIKNAEWEVKNGCHRFTITADRFLRGMVRAIAGTLLQAGRLAISLNDFRKIITGKNRSEAAASVPACGLYLSKVEYPYLKISRLSDFPFGMR